MRGRPGGGDPHSVVTPVHRPSFGRKGRDTHAASGPEMRDKSDEGRQHRNTGNPTPLLVASWHNRSSPMDEVGVVGVDALGAAAELLARGEDVGFNCSNSLASIPRASVRWYDSAREHQIQHPFRASSPGGFPVAAATRVREWREIDLSPRATSCTTKRAPIL